MFLTYDESVLSAKAKPAAELSYSSGSAKSLVLGVLGLLSRYLELPNHQRQRASPMPMMMMDMMVRAMRVMCSGDDHYVERVLYMTTAGQVN